MYKSTESVSEYVYVSLSINLYIYICESVTDILSLSKERHLCVTGKHYRVWMSNLAFVLRIFFDAADIWPVFNNTNEQDKRELSLYGELNRKKYASWKTSKHKYRIEK